MVMMAKTTGMNVKEIRPLVGIPELVLGLADRGIGVEVGLVVIVGMMVGLGVLVGVELRVGDGVTRVPDGEAE